MPRGLLTTCSLSTRTVGRSLAAVGLAGALAVSLSACGQAGSSNSGGGGGGNIAAASKAGCAPVAGQDIVMLADDKKLQNSDNVVPALNAKAATPPLLAALDKVSAALKPESLISLNKKVDIERKTALSVANGFVTENNLTAGLAKGSGPIVVGAANFSESQVLAGIYTNVLTAAGFAASTKTIGNRELYLPALQDGQIQVVPEYAATLTEFLNPNKNTPKATPEIATTMTALTTLGKAKGLAFAKPATAATQNAFAVTKAFADKNKIKTLTEFGAKCSGKATSVGGPPECKERPFCAKGLETKYGLGYGTFTALDAGGPLSKQGLKTGKVTIALVFSSDGSLTPIS